MSGEFKSRPIVSLVFGLGLAGVLLFGGHLREDVGNVYEPPPSDAVLAQSTLRFEEVSDAVGIKFSHAYFPGPPIYLATMFPAVSVVDLDEDGYMDLYFSSGHGNGVPNLFYRNEGGTAFTEIGESLGIRDMNKTEASSFSVFADFDRDGNTDLLVAAWGCHHLLFGQGPGKPFRDVTPKLQGYCSNPNGVGVADLDKDGILDLVFGNFLPDEEHTDRNWHMPTKGDREHGGRDHVLFGAADGSFPASSKVTFPEGTYTHAIGLTDLDRDGYPDILMSTDWSSDDMFRNRGDRHFDDVTDRYIDRAKAGNSSMNSEIFDFDQDEWPDIYITNAFKPPYIRAHNNMWKRNPGKGFEEVALDEGAGRCGFSWGAKFADFDLDGESDLMVINGRLEGPNVKSTQGAYSFWYERFLLHEVPVALRKDYLNDHVHQMPPNFYMSSFERNCLFQQKNSHFYDVAAQAGVADRLNGRGLALVDYDNDGKLDLVIANIGAKALVYHNVTASTGDWIGFDLDGGPGKRTPFGARLELERLGKTRIIREIFPTNGMKSQSDPRVVVGAPANVAFGRAVVVWADGAHEAFAFTKNKYNRLVRGQGTHVDGS
ncbi:CRTAC1 family protein [soil metagenome]